MTIKGPYLVPDPHLNSASETYAAEWQAWARNVYEQKATRQILPNDGTEGYVFVWFTDRGTAFSPGQSTVPIDTGPHKYWDFVFELTYYPKADRNMPARVTKLVTYSDYPSSMLGGHLYEATGKTMWTYNVGSLDGLPALFYDVVDLPSGTPVPDGFASSRGYWGFDGREFDFASMRLTIVPQDAPEYAGSGVLELEARPRWEVVSARYLSTETLEVCMGTDFGRTDDRWCLESVSYVTGDKLPMLRGAEPWGTLAGVRERSVTVEDYDLPFEDGSDYAYVAVAHVAATDLARVVGGRMCHFAMHVNHAWNVAGDNSVPATGDREVQSDGYCAIPDLEVEVDDCAAVVRVVGYHDSDDYGDVDASPPDAVVVAMAGAKFQDDIQVVDGATGTARFPYVPLCRYTTFEAVGINEVDGVRHTSDVAAADVRVTPGFDEPAIVVTAADGSAELKARHRSSGSDRGPSVSVSNDAVTEQFAGRALPSVFYGGSHTTSVSFDGVLVGEDGTDWEELPTRELCVLRFPDGRRYAANCSVSVSGTSEGLVSLSVSGDEVDF